MFYHVFSTKINPGGASIHRINDLFPLKPPLDLIGFLVFICQNLFRCPFVCTFNWLFFFLYFRIMVCLRRNKLRNDLQSRIQKTLNLPATKWKKFWQKFMKPSNLGENPQRSCLNWKLISWCTFWRWKNSTGTVDQNWKSYLKNKVHLSK